MKTRNVVSQTSTSQSREITGILGISAGLVYPKPPRRLACAERHGGGVVFLPWVNSDFPDSLLYFNHEPTRMDADSKILLKPKTTTRVHLCFDLFALVQQMSCSCKEPLLEEDTPGLSIQK